MLFQLLFGSSPDSNYFCVHIDFHKNFKKAYKKLPTKVQTQFDVRLVLYMEDATNPILNIHKLQGKESEFYSLNVTADYRALFKTTITSVIFYKIGTHSELY